MNPFRSKMEREVWKKVAHLPEFSRKTLTSMGVNETTARNFLKRWHNGCRIDEVRVEDRLRWYVPKGAEAPQAPCTVPAMDRSPEARMWLAMRQLRTAFSPIDIAEHASTSEGAVSEALARNYCRQLLRAGYLRVHQTAVHRVRPAKYLLVINSGPRAPVIRRMQGVLDRNEGRFVPLDPEVSP